MSCHSGLRILFHFNPLILLNSPRDWGLKIAQGGQTYPLNPAGIVEFEFENILFSIKVKWSGGEEYFSPWHIDCGVWTIFSYKSLKTWKSRGGKNNTDFWSTSVLVFIELCPRLCGTWNSLSSYFWYLIKWLGWSAGAFVKLNSSLFL